MLHHKQRQVRRHREHVGDPQRREDGRPPYTLSDERNAAAAAHDGGREVGATHERAKVHRTAGRQLGRQPAMVQEVGKAQVACHHGKEEDAFHGRSGNWAVHARAPKIGTRAIATRAPRSGGTGGCARRAGAGVSEAMGASAQYTLAEGQSLLETVTANM